MSRVNALLAQFKKGQKNAIAVQAEARQEREERLAKAEQSAKAKAKPRARKTASAASGDASASVASGGGLAAAAAADWKQRSRSGQQAVPIGVKLKAVVDYLRTCSEPQRAAGITSATGFDPRTDAALAAALAANNKVSVQADGLYVYVPEVANVRNKAELLDYLRRRERQGEGYAALGELADAYPGARQDLEALKAERLIVSLPAADPTRKEVFYPIDTKMRVDIDDDLQELWLSVGEQLPEEVEEMAAELRKIGVKPAPRQVIEKREAREKKKKARKARRLTRVTNVHLKHLLEGDAPSNISPICSALTPAYVTVTPAQAAAYLAAADAALEACKPWAPFAWLAELRAARSEAAAVRPHLQKQLHHRPEAWSYLDDEYWSNPFCLGRFAQESAAVGRGVTAAQAAQDEASRCDGCGKKALGVRRCSACKQAKYCSTTCQHAAWPQHKPACLAARRQPQQAQQAQQTPRRQQRQQEWEGDAMPIYGQAGFRSGHNRRSA
ncbi:transcription initiation factor IIE subunit beta [Chlorella sorokiniana]|uniref:Transcription initiation factor IIE subunit beta n=1 Tax=Chlorella sorokiniana TaxID=3076 RepID=A0A2P6TL60_CHLSO|nr:transcription initiation factor IIE subunit beta [Chlorella sorokiniana]|eukprot:PRW45019.1 transcription initiation factor IIE subunit beta [Chlorella sorokiniana]